MLTWVLAKYSVRQAVIPLFLRRWEHRLNRLHLHLKHSGLFACQSFRQRSGRVGGSCC